MSIEKMLLMVMAGLIFSIFCLMWGCQVYTTTLQHVEVMNGKTPIRAAQF